MFYTVALIVFFISIALYLFGLFVSVAAIVAGVAAVVCAIVLVADNSGHKLP